ncbi:DUF2163 domain-containing protein [Dinoroseobacter sp. S124A]|uniref:DUF2163 domain-containing protein n=1 Tax=Dinoroseobacter sp. S124A TaxID=3415128 RepID=UPI003C7C7026
MSGADSALLAHLATGLTTVCRCWRVARQDGVVFGFTDHDLPLSFEGTTFVADSGLSAAALQQSTGLSVDNSEAIGALSDAAISEEDIRAGRFDGAGVEIWLVNWTNPEERAVQFRGILGEVQQIDGAFRAELRGLTELLNKPHGRVYQRDCTAVLGDAACALDVSDPKFSVEAEVTAQSEGRVFSFDPLEAFDLSWFERGRFIVLSGAAAGLHALIKNDRWLDGRRDIEVWEAIGQSIVPGDRVRLIAGCDKRHDTCRFKFQNSENFQGFPYIPGDDWLLSYPVQGGQNDGGSLRG